MLVPPDFVVTVPDYDIKDCDFVAYFVQVKALTDKAQVLSRGLKSWCVSRRFSEFYRLYEMLEKEIPACLIPPLPPKHGGSSSGWYKFASAIGAHSVGSQIPLDSIPGAVVGKRFDSELIDSRRHSLEIFLNRCLSHPRISQSHILLSFLRESEDWITFPLELDNATFNSEDGNMATGELVESLISTKLSASMVQKSQSMLDSVKHFFALQKQINKRLDNLNQINKQAADALHRWCPHEIQNHPFADSLQTLANSLDSYHSLLGLMGEGDAEVEERLHSHMRYADAFADFCAQEAAIHREIAAERAALLQLQNDVQALQNGTRPEFIPSVVGPVSSMTNNVINGLKSLFLNSDTSTSTSESVSPEEIEKAMERIIKKIKDTSIRLVELEEVKSEFKKSMAAEYAFFEKQQVEDLVATMRIYAGLQLQRADRCKRLWERAHAAILNATETPQLSTSLAVFLLPSISGFPSLSLGLDTESGGSYPFPPEGYIDGMCFAKQSCPVRSLNSATASILGQSAISESATVHCFSFVRALSSLYLEDLNSLLVKVFIVWKDIGRSIHCTIVVPFLASVSASSLPLMPQ
ncbi:unnamed protein product [Rodentolepis nana]|uniref:PX domain-containing protein n=1 Tax=Rodentolepis nana TaxID=102285 RepID=A0A0R3TTN9_RODNA|nr:unnamed protein product [Rodentolepis nana]